MRSEKVTFKNKNGLTISAIIDWPLNQSPKATALFAHCFTCNKNLTAVKNISRGLTESGLAVLRFDFTGLGQSEGEFEETNFETNIEDLEDAANYLEERIEAPKLLIGHSLGGTAILHSAHKIKSSKGIVTIGSPFDPKHVTHLFQDKVSEIKEKGSAKIHIGGRPFRVNKKMIETLKNADSDLLVKKLGKALLILHSPQDKIVEVANAEKIYTAAHHPKSFISMDGADHLLSDKKDSKYVGDIIGSWIKRYITIQEKEKISSRHQAAAQTNDDSLTTEIIANGHHLLADEPENLGGNNLGPTPYELLCASLASCTSLTLQMYARRKEWNLETVTVLVNHKEEKKEGNNQKIDIFERELALVGILTEKQKERLLEIANKCPIHKSLHTENIINTKLYHSE
jgi:putative redox protein